MGSADDASSILARAKAAAADRSFRLSEHAKERMVLRNANVADVRNAMFSSSRASLQENGTWRLYEGKDLDGDELVVVVDVRRGVLVVTVM